MTMKKNYSFNEKCLMRNGKPWFPVMGEMHFSRFDEKFWKESLYKMKAGGVSIVSTYVFWIHHEEEEGIFDFSGSRNLKKFVECCRETGMKLFLRIGPWVHGECRNGGFPDWIVNLQEEGVKLRTSDSRYLFYVHRFWQELFGQVKGQLEEDGGPVIGIQLENEYWIPDPGNGTAGDAHMRTLMKMAKDIGFQVSLYTATGWGGTFIGDAIPVMGGYCEAPWEQKITELAANNNYVISHIRNDALIASDQKMEDVLKYEEFRFPFLTAELGGGLQVTAHRRPVATGQDIGSMSLAKLAGGVSMLGYYMYHGGSNPKGKRSPLQESRNTGYINYNDLPEVNYDFNAPIRQYGSISDSYREIKLLALFLRDFGEELAVMTTDIETEGISPEDTHTLRKSCRYRKDHGYVFFNNYVRHRTMDEHRRVRFRGKTENGEVLFPETDIRSGEFGFFPYHMRLNDAVLETALATPLCRLDVGDREVFVFYGDREPQYRWKDDRQAEILHLKRNQAKNAFKITLDRDYLIISDHFVWEQEGKLTAVGPAKTKLRTFPELAEAPKGFRKIGCEDCWTVYERSIRTERAEVSVGKQYEDCDCAIYTIDISFDERSMREKKGDLYVWIEYTGYGLDIYCEGQKINDHFYTGQPVPVSLRYFDYPHRLTVKVKSLREGDWVYLEKWPEMTDHRACRLEHVVVTEEYQ